MRHIILLCGKRGHGKDSCAKHLIQTQGYQRLAFADQLKNEVARQFLLPRYALDSVILKERYRPLLQHYGTQKREKFGPEIWIREIIKKIQDTSLDAKVVITDWRYKNELEIIRKTFPWPENCVTTVRINAVDKTSQPSNKCDLHTSEMELNDTQVDYELDNTWDHPDQLHRSVETMLKA